MKKIYPFLLCFFTPLFLHAQYSEDVSWTVNEMKPTVDADMVWSGMRVTEEGDMLWSQEDLDEYKARREKFLRPTNEADIVWRTSTTTEDVAWTGVAEEVIEIVEEVPEKTKKPFYVKNRTFEIGLVNTSVGFSNDFISATDVFKKTMVIDIDELEKGMRINTGIDISPVYLNFNFKDKWGFRISTKLDVIGIIGLSGNMLTMSEAVDDKSDAAGAAFIEAAPSAFFQIKKFKVKVKPAMYYPLVYIKPDISYTNKTTTTDLGGETVLKLGYDLQVFTAISMEDDFSFDDFSFDSITAKPGFDLSFSLQYPLSKTLGLTEKKKFLDFDIGLDFSNIPIVPSSIYNYMRMSGQIGKDEPIDFFADGAFDDFVATEDMIYGEEKTPVIRPFKMLAWADWRPFRKNVFTFIPSFGFSINPIYVKPFSLEGGIKARMDLRNLFILTLGINYNDRLWKNSLDLALNFRIFEIDLGVDVRSPSFVKSFTGAGVGAAFGLKLGF